MKTIIDCFTFYNELELLELRFMELYNIVDKFIIIEANKTFKGDCKPFILEENKQRFQKWWHKVAYIKIDIPNNFTDPWSREKYQRNSSLPFLHSMGLSDNSIVIITDLDEIPNSDIISHIKEEYHLEGIFKLEMDNYFGSLFNKQKDKWYHPKIINWGNLISKSPEECRLTFDCQWWEKAGWHFSYFGGPARISAKLNDFSHQEYNTDYYKDENYILEKIKNGKDLFGEWREFSCVDPEKNENLPKNWRILLPLEEKYKIKNGNKKFNI